MILKHFANNEHYKNPFPARFLCFGSCIPAQALKQAFADKVEVLTPDLSLHLHEALAFITFLCEHERPNVLVGNSNGSFLDQIVASRLKLVERLIE